MKLWIRTLLPALGAALLLCALTAAASADECVRDDSEGLIVLSAWDGSDYELYAMAPDGRGLRALTETPHSEFSPRISPDGARVVYSRSRQSQPRFHEGIFSISIDGADTTKIVRHRGRDSDPDWTPDGRVVFASNRSGSWNLYVKVIGGHGSTRLQGARGSQPDVSPDGTNIVFERRIRKHTFAPWVLNLTSGELSSVGLSTGSDPRWSPDGTTILFQAGCCLDPEPVWSDLYSVMPGTPGVHHLEPSEPLIYHEQPAWSPNGTRIAFVVHGDQEGDPYRIAVADYSDPAGTEHLIRRVGRTNANGAVVMGIDWGRAR
jgi:Tol biopolymer transport system component